MPTLIKSLAVLFIWALLTPPALAEKRVALVIGNSAYSNVADLPNTRNDAQDMQALLRGMEFDVTPLADLGVNAMREALAEFSDKAAGADVALVFFAGHGMEVNKRNFLIPVDAKLATDRRIRFEAVPLDDVLGALEGVRGLSIVLLDACRNNPFASTMKMVSASRSIGRGLARVEPVTGSLIGFAAKEGTTAADGKGRNSPYTTALLKHLKEPGVDLRLAFAKVRDTVMSMTGNAQQPFTYSSLPGKEIYLTVPGPAPSQAQPGAGGSVSQPANNMARDFELARSIGTRAAWEAFLAARGSDRNNYYVQLAKAALQKLAVGTFPAPAPVQPQDPAAAPELYQGEVKIGSAGGITGPIASIVKPLMKARSLAARQVNGQGGMLGGGRLILVPADTACDPKKAARAGKTLVTKYNVLAIIGPNCSGAVLAAARKATIAENVLLLSDTATSRALTALADNDTVFRASAADGYQGNVLARLAYEDGVRSAAVLFEEDGYNKASAEAFRTGFRRLGGRITGMVTHKSGGASEQRELRKLAKARPQALALFAGYRKSGRSFLKRIFKDNIFPRVYGAETLFTQDLVAKAGGRKLSSRLTITFPRSTSANPSHKMFADAFKGIGGDPGSPFAAESYDAAFLTALAVEKSAGVDRSKISKALRFVAGPPGKIVRPGQWKTAKQLIRKGEDINYEGASGDLDFDAAGDVESSLVLYTVNSAGKWKTAPLD